MFYYDLDVIDSMLKYESLTTKYTIETRQLIGI